MRMKLTYIYIAFIACIIALTSCSDNTTELEDATGYSIINADITSYNASIPNDNLILGAGEYNIKRARLYAFDGDILDNMKYVEGGNVGSILMNLKVKQSASKTLYIIINEPQNPEMTTRLALLNHPKAFEELEFAMADYVTKAFNAEESTGINAFCLPMFGKKESVNTITNSATTPINVGMEVTRSLARVDIMLQKSRDVNTPVYMDANTAIDIKNIATHGMIGNYNIKSRTLTSTMNAANSFINSTDIPTKNVSDNNAAIRAYTFYTPEINYSVTKQRLAFSLKQINYNGKPYDFDVTIGDQPGNYLNKIERNKVHKIYCTLKNKEIDINIAINDWINVNVYGNIEATKLIVSQSTITMDWAQLNNSYTATLKITSDGNITFDGFEHDNKTTLDGSNLPTWLPVATISGLPDGKGKSYDVKLSYKVALAKYQYDRTVKLWFKAGSIRKSVTVYYDNGFLPNEYLKSGTIEPWLENLPNNGVQLNKRGLVNPMGISTSDESYAWSTDTETILFDISEKGKQGHLHGKGPYNTDWMIYTFIQHHSVARLCRALGPNWYVPSSYEIMTVRRLQDYLGPSYYFDDNAYLSSTSYYDDSRYVYCSTYHNFDRAFLANRGEPFKIRCLRNY